MKVHSGRKIPKNYNNITGRLYSEKAKNASIAFESKLERDFYMLFEFMPEVLRIEEQPFTLENDSGERYTPDFKILIQTEDGEKEIVGEIKYRKDLKKNWDKLKKKFQMALSYCQMRENMEFKIFTDRCSLIANREFMFNLHFLMGFRELDYTAQELMKKNFKKGTTVGKLLLKCSDDEYERMRIASSLWYLVRKNAIKVDLSKKLSYDTVLIDFKPYYGYAKSLQPIRHMIKRSML